MTFRSREEDHHISEAFLSYSPECLYWLEHWNQSTPPDSFLDCTPPASPDTLSDCPSADLSSMSSLTLSQGSSPVEWLELPGTDQRRFMPSVEDWSSCRRPVTTRNSETSGTIIWPNAADGSVGLGLSPVPSYESQNSRTLNSFSEPDLTSAWDLPLPAEPMFHRPVVYSHPDYSSQVSQDLSVPYPVGQSLVPMTCTSPGPVGYYPGCIPRFYPLCDPVALSTHAPHAYASPMRSLLPWNESGSMSYPAAYGPYRAILPGDPGSHASQPPTQDVSNTVSSQAETTTVTRTSAASSETLSAASSQLSCSMPTESDPTAEEFKAFIQLEPDDHFTPGRTGRGASQPNGPLGRHYAEYKPYSVNAVDLFPTRNPSLPHVDPDVKKSVRAGLDKSPRIGLGSDAEEGRHRTHADYSRPPHADGYYHCPYKAKEKCVHKATKLKCNYDKYIDSHVKPFRCKLEVCSKQEFSSTACLLRHEREAHGMHGHGDRPHLCYYTGCERALPGSGFPRRYNLFDHMKRVHDYREDAVDPEGSPILGGETQKKIKGAKRKQSSPHVSEPAVQRQRTRGVPQRSQAIPIPHGLYYHNPASAHSSSQRPGPYGDPLQKYRMPYSEWARHRTYSNAD